MCPPMASRPWTASTARRMTWFSWTCRCPGWMASRRAGRSARAGLPASGPASSRPSEPSPSRRCVPSSNVWRERDAWRKSLPRYPRSRRSMVRSIARCDWRRAVSESRRPTQFGRIHAPDETWLATQPPEPILEPELPIIDTHQHLWERPDHRYLLHEFLADVRTGHNLVASVFVECESMYRAGGPRELRSVGEAEFVAGMAAHERERPVWR